MLTSHNDLVQTLQVARALARRAGTLLHEGFLRDPELHVEHKGEVDLVTIYDRRSEALLVEELGRTFPTHRVIAEEGSTAGPSHGEDCWFIDPLDGTTNYAHRLPWYTVSLGLERAGQPLLGVIYAPALDWEFWTSRGGGAWLNGTRLRVSRTPDLDRALIATGFPYDRRTARDNNVPEFATIIRRCQGIRRMGAASLDCALVAQGCLDGYWEFKLKPWDISAGALLVQEAGGKVTLPDGQPYCSAQGALVATNGLVHDELLAALATAGQGRSAAPHEAEPL